MKNIIEISLILILCTYSVCSIAQDNTDHVIAQFNTLEYYPDSTIKIAYNLKGNKIRGYSVEFNSTGRPIWIGKYRNGLKHGKWLQNDGGSRLYKRGEIDWGYSLGLESVGLEMGNMKSIKRFQKLYARLTK
ncbi:MAG: hypothetical protein COA38_12875 [Fluviicola sp.]|nr:MAG: hypothetical protein COA38_12875 [Fluviicola sp.]